MYEFYSVSSTGSLTYISSEKNLLGQLSNVFLFGKVKLKCLKKGLRLSITEKRQNDCSKWRHTSETGHGMKKSFQNVSLIMLKNFYKEKNRLKTSGAEKGDLSHKITEKRQNDGCMTSYVKIGTWYENENFYKMFFWSCWTTFTMINIA